MRPGQHNNKRMRGRNNNNNHNRGSKNPNPLSRVHESNGPDVKIRGTVHHIIEKYMQLGRDAQASGDRVTAENYYQHAEHYFRVLVAAQQQISPHFVPSIRVDDQPIDEEAEDGESEGVVRQGDGEGGPNGGAAAGHAAQMHPDERRERSDGQRFEGRGRGYGDRSYQGRGPQPSAERGEVSEQPPAEFPLRDDGRVAGERPERAPRPERFRRDERHRDDRHREERPETAEGDQQGAGVAPEAANGASGEGREPGLPSFLTRGRRRGRPAYRRPEAETEGEAPAPDSKLDTPAVE